MLTASSSLNTYFAKFNVPTERAAVKCVQSMRKIRLYFQVVQDDVRVL